MKRVTERVALGDRVEIRLRAPDRWVAGRVIGLAPPGVWVQTAVGNWFVTHPGRIRRQPDNDEA